VESAMPMLHDLVSEERAVERFRAAKIRQVSPIAPIASSLRFLDDHYIRERLKDLGCRFPMKPAAFNRLMAREFPDLFGKIQLARHSGGPRKRKSKYDWDDYEQEFYARMGTMGDFDEAGQAEEGTPRPMRSVGSGS